MIYDKGNPFTGSEILDKIHSIGKYSFCFGLLNRAGELIHEEAIAIYEPEYNEIIKDLSKILVVTDLSIGESIFSGDHFLTLREKEWFVVNIENFSQPYTRLIFESK